MSAIQVIRSSRLGRWIAAIWGADPAYRSVAFGSLLLAAFAVMNVAIHVTTGWSSIKPTLVWLLGDLPNNSDSWEIMIKALAWWREHPDTLLYQEVFFRQQIKFQYFPTSLLPLVALEAMGIAPSPALFNSLNRVLVALTVVGVGVFSWLLSKRTRPDVSATAHLAVAGFVGLATVVFYPVMMANYLGQVQVWINALFVFACIAFAQDRRAAAGVFIGLICLLKPQFGLFAVWALIRRDWSFFAGLAATGAIGLLASLAIFGVANHLDYLPVLSFLSRHGESFLPNFSFNGLLHHLLGNDAGLKFEPHGFPPFHPLVYAGTLITSLAISAVGLWPAKTTPVVGSVIDFQRAAMAFTIASPIAWEHHYGVAAPVIAALFCHALSLSDARRRLAWLIAVALVYGFMANALEFTRAFTATPINVLQSYTLFAGLAALVMLLRLGRQSPAPGGAAT